jgi:hypothetical protein
MSTTLARLLLGGFLIAHGLVHGLYFAPPEENNPKWAFQLDRSWILEHLRVDPSVWRRIGLSLSVVVIAALVLAGLGVWVGVGAWRVLAVAGAAVGLVLFALFWHRWLWIGTLLNAAIIVALVWASWPPASALGE